MKISQVYGSVTSVVIAEPDVSASADNSLKAAISTGVMTITLGSKDGVTDTKWSNIATYLNNAFGTAVKAELTGTDAVAEKVDPAVALNQDAKSEQLIKVKLTFSDGLKAGNNGEVTINSVKYKNITIADGATTVEFTLGKGVTTAAKVEKLDGFTNVNGTPAILPAGGLVITK